MLPLLSLISLELNSLPNVTYSRLVIVFFVSLKTVLSVARLSVISISSVVTSILYTVGAIFLATSLAL